jgi:hypothetical protein
VAGLENEPAAVETRPRPHYARLVAGADLDVQAGVGRLQGGSNAPVARKPTILRLEVEDNGFNRPVGAHLAAGYGIDDVSDPQASRCKPSCEVPGLPLGTGHQSSSLEVERRRAGQIDRDVGTMLPRHGALL